MIQLYNEDCMPALRAMKDNQFDLAIVDPPYGIGLGFSKSHKNKNGSRTKGHDQKKWNESTPKKEYFNELMRVSEKYIIWGCNYYKGVEFDEGRIIHHKKPTPFLSSTYSHADIAATNTQKRITLFEFQWSGNVQNGTMNTQNKDAPLEGLEKRIHPTQKPVNLYRWLLKNYAKEGDKILDTHLGSGSIAIACHDMGFDLTGYEIDKDYYEAAVKRYENHKAQLSIFA